jgi:phosphotransferase system enzyme I (PtsP)
MAAVLLLGMGYDMLSMNATSLPRVKRAIRAITATDARELFEEVRVMDSGQQIEQRLEIFMRARDLQQLMPAPVD